MKEIYFIVEALSELILPTTSTSTGNVLSWDYIPGSRFLGIAAKNLYEQLSPSERLQVFHKGNYSFGDALPVMDDRHRSYHLPLAIFGKKGTSIIEHTNYVYHKLPDQHSAPNTQLVQRRGGYITTDKFYLQVKKRFALKAAFDRETRRAKDEAMFGFESLLPGQKFIFSLRINDDNKRLTDLVVQSLEGIHSVGKSKTAQYGKVYIQTIPPPSTVSSLSEEGYLYIYVDTPIAVLNPYGHPTFEITPSLFHLPESSEIDWSKSQVRTFSYSTWNIKRTALNTERHVIVPGSVLVVTIQEEISIAELPTQIGAYRSEGLGRVVYNPEFLNGSSSGEWSWKVQSPEFPSISPTGHALAEALQSTNPLIGHLANLKVKREREYQLYQMVHDFMESTSKSMFKRISSSQWGALRERALRWKLEKYPSESFIQYIVDDYLAEGTRAQKYWKRPIREALKKQLQTMDENMQVDFLILLAHEMAKTAQLHREADSDVTI